ncbi:AMP-binding protein [Halopiger goleimassiliensis]|uniref:AMP-binding protein n=1 Tax=Halopiger goleimassiliensis TaxID=1293048 RepID=UPI000677CBDD|nr:AMP-binding protein [Halopiger goleimassiliensis]
MPNVTRDLQHVVMENQTEPAIEGDDPLAFSTLWTRTDAFAGALQDRNITADDAVAIQLSDPEPFLVAVLGALRNGSVPVTIPGDLGTSAVTTAVTESGAKAYVTDRTRFLSVLNRTDDLRVAITTDTDARMGVDMATVLENDGINGTGSRTGIDVVRRSNDDPALIAYDDRDGTDPVGIRYTHAAVRAATQMGSTLHGADADDYSYLGVLPLANPLESCFGALAAIFEGGRYQRLPDWHPDDLRAVLRTRPIDRTVLTRTQYEQLEGLESTDEDRIAVLESVTDLEWSTQSSAVVAPSDDVRRLFGTAETGITHVADAEDDGLESVGLVTTAGGGGDADAFLVRTPAAMEAYVDRPDETAETVTTSGGDRWLRTSALASVVSTTPVRR